MEFAPSRCIRGKQQKARKAIQTATLPCWLFRHVGLCLAQATPLQEALRSYLMGSPIRH